MKIGRVQRRVHAPDGRRHRLGPAQVCSITGERVRCAGSAQLYANVALLAAAVWFTYRYFTEVRPAANRERLEGRLSMFSIGARETDREKKGD